LKNAPNVFDVAFTGKEILSNHCNGLKLNNVLYSPGQYSYPDCGRNVPATGNPLAVGGNSTDIKEFPWQVALYTFKEQKLDFKCGGTLISRRFILTGKITSDLISPVLKINVCCELRVHVFTFAYSCTLRVSA
jgi:hypothetical protein